jgi:2-polyprenyl-6-methoxyphenol hydroxylase-like FAD-dependent oxidoreductase
MCAWDPSQGGARERVGAEQSRPADALQRPLRSRFRARLTRGVRCLFSQLKQQEAIRKAVELHHDKKEELVASVLYDIITVGGGLGGSSLAKAMVEHGARVLVLERERQFRDRVRGEILVSWGVAEAKALGIYDLLRATCGRETRWFAFAAGPEPGAPRDLIATTAQQAPYFSLYHPAMQEVLLQAAIEAGAEVRRGASVRDVKLGTLPSVVVEQDGGIEEIQARLVVCADGRGSLVRKRTGFPVHHDPERLLITGVLFEDMPTPQEDTSYYIINPTIGQGVPLFPQGNGRVRAYLVHTKATSTRLQGEADLPRFVEESIRSGAPAEWYAGVKVAGPLATFDGADTWVDHPYKEGVVLIGDAAAASDPSWGQGLSLTLRDARVLRDQLLTHTDWDAAGHAYAMEHDRHYGVIHRVDNWLTQMFFAIGPEAEACRARALPLIAQDETRAPDHGSSGPDLPADETVRRRFFGEE